MYFILCILALSFFSCKEEDPIDDVDPNRISFFVGDKSYANPKGTILTNTNFFKFNVYAYYSTTTMSPTTPMSPFINNLVVAKSLNTWNYVGDYYWPDSNYVQFFGVANDENNNALPTGVSNWTIGQSGYPSFTYTNNTLTSAQKDLVISKSLDKKKSNSPLGVNMFFQHVLTKLNVTYHKPQGNPYRMTKIEVLNAESSALYTFNSLAGSWSNYTNTLPLVYWQGDQRFQNDTIILNENMFIIPQSTLTIRFTYLTNQSIQRIYTFNISPSQIGGSYRYKVLVPN